MKKKGRGYSGFNVFSTIILVLLISVVVFVFITRLSGHVFSVFGYTLFHVQTDSMEPTLMVGDIILDKKVPAEEIKVGDIITYDCLSGDLAGHTITHRVIREPENKNGVYYFQTKGDKPGAEPDAVISYDQIEGKFIQTIPWLNKVYSFFLSPYGLVTFIVLILVLFGYEMLKIFSSYRAIDEKDDDYYAPKPKKPSKKRKKK